MPRAKARHVKARRTRADFDAEAFLRSAGAARRVTTYPRGTIVFSQGQPSDVVLYIQKGGIKISQETLAKMIGTTRSRVNFFMNKFRDLGFIEYNGGLTINTALLSVVLHD